MSKRKNPCIGSSFDSALKVAGILEEVQAEFLKNLLAEEVKKEMEKLKISKSDFAKKMRTSRAALRRVLDPSNTSITLSTINKVAYALGKQALIKFQ